MADEDKDPGDITPSQGTAAGHDEVRFTETIEEAKAKLAAGEPAETVTAEGLGVDQASYDKYFKDGDFDWASYGKEQAFKAKGKTAGDKGDDTGDKAADVDVTDDTEVKNIVESAGLDWDQLGLQIVEDGTIKEEDRAALEKIGVPKLVVDQYIDAVKNEAQSVIDDVIDAAGGQETFNALFDALQEQPLEFRNKVDDLLRDPDTRAAGIDLAYSKTSLTKPTAEETKAEPKPVGGSVNSSGPAPGEQLGYKSFEEQAAAQQDPRYKTDAAYRGAVMAKIAQSTYQSNPRAHRGGL